MSNDITPESIRELARAALAGSTTTTEAAAVSVARYRYREAVSDPALILALVDRLERESNKYCDAIGLTSGLAENPMTTPLLPQ